MLNFGASKPRVRGGARAPGAPPWIRTWGGHGNRFVTTEPKFVYLKSPGVKFMNYLTDLKNPLLKSFGSYKVEYTDQLSRETCEICSSLHVGLWEILIFLAFISQCITEIVSSFQ